MEFSQETIDAVRQERDRLTAILDLMEPRQEPQPQPRVNQSVPVRHQQEGERRGHTMSEEGRQRIREAQRKRWAAARGEVTTNYAPRTSGAARV